LFLLQTLISSLAERGVLSTEQLIEVAEVAISSQRDLNAIGHRDSRTAAAILTSISTSLGATRGSDLKA
jgi:hypothetical protein